MCIVDLLRELKQNDSFAVLPALQQRISQPHAIFTFTNISDEKSGNFLFVWPKLQPPQQT